jgi:hypothetical protein
MTESFVLLTSVTFFTLLALIPLSPACFALIVASFINLNGIVSNYLLPHIPQSAKYGRLLIAVYIRLKKQGIVEENLENSLAACFGRRVEKLTRTSTFLLRFRFECALTIFLTVARGYSFWPAAIVERAAMAMAILVLLDPAVDEKEGVLLFSSALLPMKAERWYHTGTTQPIKGQQLKPCQTSQTRQGL